MLWNHLARLGSHKRHSPLLVGVLAQGDQELLHTPAGGTSALLQLDLFWKLRWFADARNEPFICDTSLPRFPPDLPDRWIEMLQVR